MTVVRLSKEVLGILDNIPGKNYKEKLEKFVLNHSVTDCNTNVTPKQPESVTNCNNYVTKQEVQKLINESVEMAIDSLKGARW